MRGIWDNDDDLEKDEGISTMDYQALFVMMYGVACFGDYFLFCYHNVCVDIVERGEWRRWCDWAGVVI
jgi:hypothetical protein